MTETLNNRTSYLKEEHYKLFVSSEQKLQRRELSNYENSIPLSASEFLEQAWIFYPIKSLQKNQKILKARKKKKQNTVL